VELLMFVPVAVMAIIGVVLATRPGLHSAIRIAGLVLALAAAGFLLAWINWWNQDCWDTGEIPGCDAPESYMLIVWLTSVIVCVVAALLVGVRFIRRSAGASHG
jgi:hypothetical protein